MPAKGSGRRTRFAVAAFVAALAAACASPLERGDRSWDRGDFDGAAELYDQALRSGVPEERRDSVAARLAEARGRAAEAHLQRSRQHEALGDIEGAEVEAVAADLVSSSEATAARLGEVRAAKDRAIPSDWILTVHGAVVLPFKPVEKTAWDGPGSAPVPGADAFLSMLAKGIYDPGPSMIRAGDLVARWATQAVEAPDCYPEVTLDGKTTGGPDLEDQDDFLPAWHLRVPLRGTSSDDRVISILVRDADVHDDDNVGSWQTTVGDLICRPGVREVMFVDREGRTAAGGIVALRISVERARN